ncbi:hypothetical protein GJ496_007289 [Pomphorhynchus laevis]|nr:hypothetical protein GJ496_007289 [Pomphorhynchus laevis]
MSADFDYKVEYAKSDRSSCRKCKSTIGKDSLRIARMVQSHMFDGKIPFWYHYRCFFHTKPLPTDLSDIGNLDSVRFDDQEKIKSDVAANKANPMKQDKYEVLYQGSTSATCAGCNGLSNELFISEKVKVKQKTKTLNYHIECFKANHKNFEGTSESFVGFDKLTVTQKRKLNKVFGTNSRQKSKGINDDKLLSSKSIEYKQLKKQSELMWKVRNTLSKSFDKQYLTALLRDNNQCVPIGEAEVLDAVVDMLCFGCLQSCPECKGRLIYKNYAYRCTGNISEWTTCQYFSRTVQRHSPDISADLIEFDFFKSYKYQSRERILLNLNKECDSNFLRNLQFGYLPGTLSKKPAIIRKELKKHNCTLISGYKQPKLFAVITSANGDHNELNCKLPLLTEDFISKIDTIKSETDLEQFVIANKEYVKNRVATFRENSESNKTHELHRRSTRKILKENTRLKRSVTDNVKIVSLKDGCIVDPDSDLQDFCHVVIDSSIHDPISVTLGYVDVVRGTNSYYKLQLLKDDNKSEYFVFRSWGRIGTTIGGVKTEEFDNLYEAMSHFEYLYISKTGNQWKHRQSFKKVPYKFYPLDIDTDIPENKKRRLECNENENPCQLALSVQKVVKLILDVEQMNHTLLELKIDTNKLPLGKISKRQIHMAFNILTELQQLIETNKASANQMLDATNRFFTLIPHYFEINDKMPILDNNVIITTKSSMLTDLLDIEIAYSILNEKNDDINENPIDSSYKRLSCNIQPICNTDEEFLLISKYLKNTHGITHNEYNLYIEDLYKVNRNGEQEAYKPFKEVLHNRMLLWHGSRVTNFAGILSQGLRIAPPEAPTSGYMFGKGIYFADMASKSANYCLTNQENPVGLMLLCEVALGNMYELTNAKYIKKLPDGKHSTKGIGRTMPNPEEHQVMTDGVIVPSGKPISSGVSQTSLAYNEYIVYDVNQVNLKYLVMIRFEFKQKRRNK